MRLNDRALASLVERGDIYVWDGANYRSVTLADIDQDLFVKLHDGSYSNYPPTDDGRNLPPPELRTPSAREEIDEGKLELINKATNVAKIVDKGAGCAFKGVVIYVIANIAVWILIIVVGLIISGKTFF